jgi:hypothetical protein
MTNSYAESGVITMADLDAQIEALRATEQAKKRQARDLEREVKDVIRPELHVLVALKKSMTKKVAS